MIRAVIFDMDGVLIDTEKYYTKYWTQAGQALGFPVERVHGLFLRSYSGKYCRPLLEEMFGPSFDYGAVRELRKRLMEPKLLADGVKKKPGADEILDALTAMGIKTAVATASDIVRADQYLKAVGLYEKFDEIICADMIERGKPMPDIYRYACDRLHLKPSECIAVEDSPNGILSAYQAGCAVVMVPDLTEPDEVTGAMLTACVKNLRELRLVLDQLNKTGH